MPLTIETNEEVMFFDTDCGGVVHNIAYLRWIETARTRLAAQLGLVLSEMATTGLFPVVLRTEIDYKRSAKLGDQVTIHGKVESIERARFWCAFTITRPPDPTILISCRQSLALVQMPAARPIRLPASWATDFPGLVSSK